METLWQDLKYAARTLGKKPGFAAVAVLTLALGLGANTAIFSVVNALLLRPYPFPGLDRLVLLRPTDHGRAADDFRIAPADFLDLKSETQSYEQMSAFRYGDYSLTGAGLPESVAAAAVMPNFFDVIGVQPALGRGFAAEEDQPGRDRVAVLSHGYWQRRFAGDPSLIGKTLQLNGRSCTVVGIMPPRYAYPLAVELWLPLALSTEEKTERSAQSLHGIGRLRAGVSLKQASAELGAFAARLAERYPKTDAGRGLDLLRLREEQYRFTAPLFLMLQLAAIFVLLLACANLANLLFARVIARQKEIAIRTSLGANRRQMAQLFLIETLLLSLGAGGLAVAVSSWTVDLIRTSLNSGYTKYVAGWNDIRVDNAVLLFTLLLAVLVGVVFGIATATQSSQIHLNETLKEGSGGPLFGHSRLRSALVSVQVVLAMVLLVGAGLMIKGFVHLVGVYQGLDPVGVLRLEISLPKQKYAEDVQVTAFYEQTLRSVSALPGVQSAAVAVNTPASNVDNDRAPFQIEGHPARSASEMPVADLQVISADFFRTLRIPLRAGRAFSEQDRNGTLRVAIISQSMARRFWPGKDPLDQRVKLGAANSDSPWLTIVGVVGDVKQNWWDPQPKPTVYRPYLQAPERTMAFLVRSSGDMASAETAVREEVHRLDPELAPNEINTMEKEIADALGPIRIIGILMMVFGSVALALSAVGVYGVLAQAVAQRTREFGIRLALGANSGDLLRLVLRQALMLAGVGLAAGLPIAFALSRAMEAFLFGVVALNLGVLAGFMLLLAVALAAGYFPARRAMRVDPLVALRHE